MKMIYKYISLTLFLIISLTNITYGQKTIDELGTIVFNSFKNDSIDNICKLKPSAIQLQEFLNSLGIDKSSLSITDLEKMNKGLIVELRDLCEKIHQDTLRYNLSWRNAILDKVKTIKGQGVIGTSNVKGKVITIITAKIYFSSNEQHFVLDIGDISKYNDTWKLGGGNLKLAINNDWKNNAR